MVGKKISSYITMSGMSFSKVAESVGLTAPELSSACDQDTMDCILYYKICKALGVPLDKFLVSES
ncbi:MAG: helix-turn-helix domain-containing protein [Lachnospiraceae bacterium]|nr:helix-turn-helix domain-containing protein [Lachnospiraceae bacterium]